MLAGAGATLASPAVVRAQARGGVALVVGNSKYLWEAQLANVRRDAPDVAKSFQSMGLKTELVQDVSRDALRRAVDKFKSAASGANFAAFYYAGHGASWEKDTYLVSVDADLGTPSVVKTLLPVTAVTDAMKSAANRLLVFDNCRNNPADGWRQLAAERQAGFNQDKQRADAADADTNSLTLYSTAPGHVALDGPPGQNSPFAAAFLGQLASSSVDLQALPAKLRRELLIATEGRQVVWDRNNYQSSFVMGGAVKSGGSAGTAGDRSRIIELPNAYAFARKNGLVLPEGLIAYRPPAGSPHAQKVGAFQFMAHTPRGPSPYLFIVVSIRSEGRARLIASIQNDAGHIWRFINGTVSGNRLTFQPTYGRPNYLVDWSDANSGSVAALIDNRKGTGGSAARNVPFTRLDG